MRMLSRFKRRNTVEEWAHTIFDGRMVESFGAFGDATYMIDITARRRRVDVCVIKRLEHRFEDLLEANRHAARVPISTDDASKLLSLLTMPAGERRYLIDRTADKAPADAAEALREIAAEDAPALFAHAAFDEAAAPAETAA